MPLQLYASNSLERLSQKLSEDLRNHRGNVFLQPVIITQTEGINSWLKIQIAGQLGIACNLSFSSPADIISNVYAVVCRKKMPPSGTNQLQWMMYQLLGESEFIQKFPEVSRYYIQQDAKRLSLALKVADLFDQYQVYRPKQIEDWNNGIIGSEADLHWQCYLWNRLNKQFAAVFTDRTIVTRQILNALEDEENRNRLKQHLPYIYFFGLAIITPFYLELFKKISETVSVSFYLNNPAPDTYWMDQVTENAMVKMMQRDKRLTSGQFNQGNDLLLNWGQVIKDSFWFLFNNDSFLNVYDDSCCEAPQEPDSLLRKIQTDIYNNAVKEERQPLYLKDTSDGSITINSAYTPAREVEVLYNYLVHLVDKRKELLAPRDILVMVNDIDQYAPYIRAVFDNAPYQFPYKIADESISQGNTLFSAIHQILELREDTFTSEKVMELLDNKYIRKRFDISQTEWIRKALKESNIRFGWKGDSTNDTRYFSWEYGLQRLLLGICISGSPLMEYSGETTEPVDAFEGDASLEIVRLIHFIKTLHRYIRREEESKTLGEWMMYLKELTEELVFEAGEQEDEDYHLFIQYAERLEGDSSLTAITVSFEAFRKGFVERLSAEQRKHSFIRGGITFCSFIPMRSVPFKVVAMLGLNYDKFPRKEKQISFSLFNHQYERGDRNVKNNDKHLFLETLLSAKHYLYLSYTGRDTKDGTELPPSLLVEELTDYVVKGVKDYPAEVRKNWITEHPMHGFSRKYFEGKGLYTYLSNEHLQQHADIFLQTAEHKEFVYKELELSQLIRFFEHPVRWYFNKVMQVYYKKNEELLLPEEEIFELEKWDLINLSKELLGVQDNEIPAVTNQWIRRGKLPLGNMGVLAAEEVFNIYISLRDTITAITNGTAPEAIPVSMQIGNILLNGELNNIFQQQILAVAMPGEKPQQVWISGFIRYLAARAMQLPYSLVLVYHDDHSKNYKTFTLDTHHYSPQQAMEKLTHCLQLFKEGHIQPLPFCASAKDYENLFLSGLEGFLTGMQKMRNSDFKDVLNDLYYSKADENGFFGAEQYPAFEAHTRFFYSDLKLKP